MSKYTKGTYVGELPEEVQGKIAKDVRHYLKEEGYIEDELEEHVQRAMDSKLGDLEELIDVNKYI